MKVNKFRRKYLSKDESITEITHKDYNFGLIRYYWDNNDEDDVFQIINDQTINDIDFNDVFIAIDKTQSKIGQ